MDDSIQLQRAIADPKKYAELEVHIAALDVTDGVRATLLEMIEDLHRCDERLAEIEKRYGLKND